MPFAIGRVVFRSPFTVQADEILKVREESKIVAAFRKTVEHQRQQIVLLERQNNDLSIQNKELMVGTRVTPEEVQAYKASSKTIMDLQSQLDELALWLRNNKVQEIARGEHNRFQSLPQTIIHYLAMTVPVSKDLKPEGTIN